MEILLPVVSRRLGSTGPRHGREARGPMALPGPLSPAGARVRPSRREAFDELVLGLVDRYVERWDAELGDVEFGTEDVPQLPDEWRDEPVPLGALTHPQPGVPARIVLFRRPIELRAKSRIERAALVDEVLVEYIAELLGRDPSDFDV